MGLNVAILPVVTKDLPISPRFTPYEFLSRCKFSNLVKKGKRGACRHKAATVLPDRTAAT